MKPSEVRARVLDEHVQIRTMLWEVESLAGRALNGDARCRAQLRAKTLELYSRLHAHMCMEDSLLYPAICDADAWGHVRGARMREDHMRQRAELSLLVNVKWSADIAELVRAIQRLANDVREDMCKEEEELLSPELLRDDVISIAQNSG
jgi:iron-sulfur cluster repair protein YtfE (RIC family)